MSDLLGSQDIFYPTSFGGLEPNANFSTATPVSNSYDYSAFVS